MLYNVALDNAITKAQVNQDGLKLIGTHAILAYAVDVNILDGKVHDIKNTTEALVVASKEKRLQVNAYN